MRFRDLVFAGMLLLTACSHEDNAVSAPNGGGVDSGGDDLAASLCPPACDAVKVCRPAADIDACRAQCAKELAGSGYLNPEFSKEFFQAVAQMDGGQSCGTLIFSPWAGDPLGGAPYDAGSHDGSILQECHDGTSRCGEQAAYAGICFTTYYVWNKSYRDAIKACWERPCGQEGSCVTDAYAPLCGLPYVGVPPDPNNLLDKACLPKDAGGAL